MSPEKVKERLKEDKEFMVGSLIALYYQQTGDERAMGTTANKNGQGFNSVDARILSDISEYYLKKGYLTDKQLRLLRPKMSKYAGQLAELDPEPLKIGSRTENKETKPTKKTAVIWDQDENQIKVTFPYDQEIVQYIKTRINGRRFRPAKEYGENFWTMPLTITNVDRLLENDFELSTELNQWYTNTVGGVTRDISVPGLDHILRPFQKEAVSYIDSRGGRALIADDMGLGKEQPLHCKILTPSGWKTMGGIKVGDKVIGSDGKPTRVKGVYPQGIKDAYQVIFSDGSSTECGLDHMWNVQDTNRRYRRQEFTTKTTREILDKGLYYPGGANKWNIPLPKPIQFNKKNLYIHPYMLGVLLGDGYLNGTGIQISNPEFDSDIMDMIEKVKPSDCSIKYHYTSSSNSCPCTSSSDCRFISNKLKA